MIRDYPLVNPIVYRVPSLFLFSLLMSVCIHTSYGQTATARAFPFLDYNAGGTETAAGDVILTSYHPTILETLSNPALLSDAHGLEFGLSYVNFINNIHYANAGLGLDIDSAQYLMFGFRFISNSPTAPLGTPSSATSVELISNSDQAYAVGYHLKLSDRLSVGVWTKLILSSIQNQYSWGFAFDVGVHYSVPEYGLEVAALAKNIGKQVEPYLFTTELPMPTRAHVSVAKHWASFFSTTLSFVNLQEVGETADFEGAASKWLSHMLFGLEYRPFTQVAVIGSYKKGSVVPTHDDVQRREISFGFRLSLQPWILTFGNQKIQGLGNVNHVSVSRTL